MGSLHSSHFLTLLLLTSRFPGSSSYSSKTLFLLLHNQLFWLSCLSVPDAIPLLQAGHPGDTTYTNPSDSHCKLWHCPELRGKGDTCFWKLLCGSTLKHDRHLSYIDLVFHSVCQSPWRAQRVIFPDGGVGAEGRSINTQTAWACHIPA